MGNDNCAYCNQKNVKVLITSDKYDSLEKNQNAICDTDYDLYFENLECKTFVMQHLGYYCGVCKKMNKGEKARKFPNLGSLQEHCDKAHHLHYCDLCLD